MYACNFIKLNDSQNKYIATSKNIYIIPNLRRVLLKLRNEREPVRSGINFTLHLVFKAWWVLSLVKVVSIIGCYCIFNLVRNIDLCVVVNNMTRHSIVNVLRTFDHDHDHQYFFYFFLKINKKNDKNRRHYKADLRKWFVCSCSTHQKCPLLKKYGVS